MNAGGVLLFKVGRHQIVCEGCHREEAKTAEMIVMAITPCRLDREHRVHAMDRDGEYPLSQTEQSA